MRDLVYGLMLRSGNDAAIAISYLVDASVDAFVEKMNKRANEIGAEDTNFENPNGLFSENHYTTAYDMAIIAGEAMKNSEFREVAGAKSWVADRGEGKFNHFYNKNKVIFDYSGGTGIKIGYTKRSGRTLVASAKRQGMEVICAVMDAPDWFNDSYKLMDHAFSCFEIDEVFKGGQRLMALPINNGDKDHVFVGTKEIISLPVSKNAETNLEIVYQLEKNPVLPIRRFQKAGTLELYEDGIQVVKHDIYYLEDIDELKSETANIHLNRIRRIFL
jgi:D-alanyl-D-alanine carboxypeptidase (penicillin-binding protein 5/6)